MGLSSLHPAHNTHMLENELPGKLAGVGIHVSPDIRAKEGGKHLVFSDDKTVIIKMSRPGQDYKRLATELAIGNSGIGTVRRALSREVLEIRGQKFIVSEYVPGAPVIPHLATPEEASLMAESLIAVHKHTPSAQARGNLDSLLSIPHKVRHRVRMHHRLNEETRNKILALVAEKVDPIQYSIESDKRVLTHGDAHSENFIYSKSQGVGVWIDLEKAKLAPVEWDIASLRHSLLVDGSNVSAWRSAQEVFSAAYPDMNNGLVERFGDAIAIINTVADIWNGPAEEAEQRAQELLLNIA